MQEPKRDHYRKGEVGVMLFIAKSCTSLYLDVDDYGNRIEFYRPGGGPFLHEIPNQQKKRKLSFLSYEKSRWDGRKIQE